MKPSYAIPMDDGFYKGTPQKNFYLNSGIEFDTENDPNREFSLMLAFDEETGKHEEILVCTHTNDYNMFKDEDYDSEDPIELSLTKQSLQKDGIETHPVERTSRGYAVKFRDKEYSDIDLRTKSRKFISKIVGGGFPTGKKAEEDDVRRAIIKSKKHKYIKLAYGWKNSLKVDGLDYSTVNELVKLTKQAELFFKPEEAKEIKAHIQGVALHELTEEFNLKKFKDRLLSEIAIDTICRSLWDENGRHPERNAILDILPRDENREFMTYEERADYAIKNLGWKMKDFKTQKAFIAKANEKTEPSKTSSKKI